MAQTSEERREEREEALEALLRRVDELAPPGRESGHTCEPE